VAELDLFGVIRNVGVKSDETVAICEDVMRLYYL
jgi:hypothetical protein